MRGRVDGAARKRHPAYAVREPVNVHGRHGDAWVRLQDRSGAVDQAGHLEQHANRLTHAQRQAQVGHLLGRQPQRVLLAWPQPSQERHASAQGMKRQRGDADQQAKRDGSIVSQRPHHVHADQYRHHKVQQLREQQQRRPRGGRPLVHSATPRRPAKTTGRACRQPRAPTLSGPPIRSSATPVGIRKRASFRTAAGPGLLQPRPLSPRHSHAAAAPPAPHAPPRAARARRMRRAGATDMRP
mmetsp:Transcript_39279/g.116877  ORF Transcript_39279/g.116877 Transcript_39279/m.116877 type:complete len:241 (+) Transcript_39279:1158-1880(+)